MIVALYVGIAVIFVVVLIVVVVVGFDLKERRRSWLFTFAATNGLEYHRGDALTSLSLPFRVFRRGDGQEVENTIWGQWDGESFRAFDFCYYTESWQGETSRSYERYSCVVLELGLNLPELQVLPKGLLGRLADQAGQRELEFESEEFNRRFRVKAPVRRFAYEFVDARMIAYLLSLPSPLVFEVSGPYVLALSPQLKASRLPALLGSTRSFRRRIPRLVWDRYATGRGDSVADRPDEP